MRKYKRLIGCLGSVAAIAFIRLIFREVTIQEPAFNPSLQAVVSQPLPKNSPMAASLKKPLSNVLVPTVVILFTQMRSGSSIVGEIFNQRIGINYFYEPLYPFGEHPCDSLSEMRVEVLRQISNCNFENLADMYAKAFNVSKRTDNFSRCKTTEICFTGQSKMSRFLSRDAKLCKFDSILDRQICPSPINTTALSNHCRKSLLVAAKVIYLCKLEWLLPLIKDAKLNLKIVHLVRDPRATANSRAKSFRSFKWTAQIVCEKLTNNAVFMEENRLKFGDNYMRIRHEDFALDPVDTTKKIYDFIGVTMTSEIMKWLHDATSSNNTRSLSEQKSQSTRRNALHVISAWRKSRSFDEISEVQKLCADAMKKLGYKRFENKEQLSDFERYSSF